MRKIDKRLVGTWKGTDNGQIIKEEVNHWVITRLADGTYYVDFTTVHIETGHSETNRSKGIWYVKDNVYYEDMGSVFGPEVYIFKVLTEKAIYFSDVRHDYHFTDYKVLLN